jgi:glycine betaine/choline ABC-type transport system substrate-binding protein
MKMYFRAVLVVFCLFLQPGCGLFHKGIRIGSKSSTEHQLLAEIVAQLLEKGNLKVDRRLALGDSAMLHAAVSSGDLDLYPEDTLSAMTLTLKESPIADATSALDRIRAEYARQFGLRVLPYLGPNNDPVLLVMKSLAEKENLTTIGSAAESKVQWQMGITPDFAARGEGQSQLAVVYKLQPHLGTLTLSGPELYKALKDGQVNLIAGALSDGMISSPEFQRLEDDKHIFPPSKFFLIARDAFFADNPGAEPMVARVNGKVSTEELSRMVREVESARQNVAGAAKDFLARAGL